MRGLHTSMLSELTKRRSYWTIWTCEGKSAIFFSMKTGTPSEIIEFTREDALC